VSKEVWFFYLFPEKTKQKELKTTWKFEDLKFYADILEDCLVK